MELNKDIINTISDQVISEILGLMVIEYMEHTDWKESDNTTIDLIYIFSNIAESVTGPSCRNVVEDVIRTGVDKWEPEYKQRFPHLYHNVKFNRIDYLTHLDYNYIADEMVINLYDSVYKLRLVGLK